MAGILSYFGRVQNYLKDDFQSVVRSLSTIMFIDLAKPKSGAPGPGCSKPEARILI